MFKSTLKNVRFINLRLQHSWVKPDGYNTGISIYNCIAKKNVPLIVGNKNHATWYTCGPTVYDSAHIGHASCYVKLDILQRILRRHFNINIISIMNITDIDDKIIKRSSEQKITTSELASYYEKEFWHDWDSLKLRRPDKIIRVTENMPIIIDFISSLVAQGRAYKAKDESIYFDVKSGSYGKLQNLGEIKGDAGVKKSVSDFALWKSAKEGEVFWASEFGNGRPGWHIECSALASSVFGSNIDIHAGGIDLRFPHHENEEAQSCAYFNKNQWVNYWIHTGHLHLKDSVKMSKSLKNTITIQELLKTCEPNTFRMACLMSHYKNQMESSAEVVKTAENYLKIYKNFISECNLYLNGHLSGELNNDLLLQELFQTANNVEEALINDFDTASCVKSINTLLKFTNKMMHTSGDQIKLKDSSSLIAIMNYVNSIFDTFGLNFGLTEVETSAGKDLSDVMDILVNFRHDVRTLAVANKDRDLLKLCDNVREQIRNNGFNLNDRTKLSTWSRS